jgi:hypothetical protein
MPHRTELTPLVDELVESYINGNARYVVDAISRLPKKQAVLVAAYVVERMSNDRSRSDFLRDLERNADR